MVSVFPLGPLPPQKTALVGLHTPAADRKPSAIDLSPKSTALPIDGIVITSILFWAPDPVTYPGP